MQNNFMDIYLGNDELNNAINFNLEKVDNIIGVGTTGSGKSEYLHVLIKKIQSKYSCNEIKLCLIDTKYVEFYKYKNSSFLLKPIANSIADANELIDSLIELAEQRKNDINKIPILLIIDEYCDLIDMHKEIQFKLERLVDLSKLSNIHIIAMAQRNLFSKYLIEHVDTKLVFMIASKKDTLPYINGNDALNLAGCGDAYVYNLKLCKDAVHLKIKRDI